MSHCIPANKCCPPPVGIPQDSEWDPGLINLKSLRDILTASKRVKVHSSLAAWEETFDWQLSVLMLENLCLPTHNMGAAFHIRRRHSVLAECQLCCLLDKSHRWFPVTAVIMPVPSQGPSPSFKEESGHNGIAPLLNSLCYCSVAYPIPSIKLQAQGSAKRVSVCSLILHNTLFPLPVELRKTLGWGGGVFFSCT